MLGGIGNALMLALYRGRGHTTDMKERLQYQQFTRQREQGRLALALVGMSNVGKSLWAGRLAESGFSVYGCDDEIEQQLAPELLNHGYMGGLAEVARWMGQPYAPQFAANQQRYLQLEAKALQDALTRHQEALQDNTVIDTTGSVVHLSPALLEALRQHTTIIHLAANPDMQQELYRQYLAHPKPVVWGDIYQPLDGELPEAALRRLYPTLLAHRAQQYNRIAHATITRDQLLGLASAEDFLDTVQHNLAVL